MKHVFNTNEVAHIWAAQSQDNGKNAGGNFYFERQTIYSYGSHFPIATIVGNDVLFTMRKYSNTTAKHISKAWQAISHKNIIECYDVPVNLKYSSTEHENNLNRWKREIKALFAELGNKRIRDTQSRIGAINSHIEKLNTYCKYFKLKIKDKELKELLKLAAKSDFVDIAIKAKEIEIKTAANKMKAATKAYDIYLSLWRNYDNEGIKELPAKTKELCNFYQNNSEALTRLRLNRELNRLETSKGIQIPVAIAKKAYKQLNGCMEGTCDNIAVPVLDYTITKTTKDTIIAGCHTIPKSDVNYIAELLNW